MPSNFMNHGVSETRNANERNVHSRDFTASNDGDDFFYNF